jgi:1-acyl-sn-glycerol-3-phosphate acyltransferase
MLTGILCAVSAAIAALLCGLTGSFSTLHWLWVLPVGFLGSFLALVALGFAVFVLICALIDPEKPRDQDTPWFRWFVMEAVQLILTVLPIRVETTGTEKLPKDGRFLLVSNHLDNIDPAFFYYCFPKAQLAFVGKRETSQMFLVNKVMPKLLCPTINRENDREALKTILRCISLLKADTVSIAVFPEGRINPYRKLAHFRPGVFKIAQKANVPIVVCTLQGTNHVIPRLLKGKGSTVQLHLLDVIPSQSLEDRTTVDIAEQIYTMMATDLGPENVLTPEEEENT